MYPSMKAEIAARDGDPRLSLLFGIAAWFLFLDHVPHNAVSALTLRNFGFSGATDLFVFVGGYTAAILYGKMMLERGFVVSRDPHFQARMATIRRLCRAVCDLHRLDRICREEIRRARDHPRIQCRRDPRPYDPDVDLRLAAPGQAAQPRCAATRHRPDGVLSDRIVWNVAPAEPDGGRIDCALSRRP